MKKNIFTLLIAVTVSLIVSAQPFAKDGRVEFEKGDKACAIIEFPYNSDLVEKAINDYMLKKGITESRSRGFQTFKGARFTPEDGELVDLYFKVERKSRKENNVSVVYLVAGRPNENVGLRTESEVYRLEEAKKFLNNMLPAMQAYSLEQEIKGQEDIIKKAEKKLKDLIDDQNNIEKRINDLQAKLSQNKRAQDEQTSEINKQRNAKTAMEARRVVIP